MENASKALIIAGAILLSILIIALGVFVFNQAKSAMGNISLSEQEVDAANAKFTSYEGKQTGSSAKSLCDVVRNYNLTKEDDPTLQVKLTNDNNNDLVANENATTNTDGKTTDAITTVKGNIKAGNSYNVTFAYDQKSGYITHINLKQIN